MLILAGLANKEVARRLELSIKTVETHRARICHKLECDHIASLVRLATIAQLEVHPETVLANE
jgi:DNA-binding CsgD family transcriptional regulator